MLRVLEYKGNEKIFNLGTGERHSINNIIDSIEALVDHPVQRKYLPGRPADVLDITRIRRAFEWKPKALLKDGIPSILKYLKAFHPAH